MAGKLVPVPLDRLRVYCVLHPGVFPAEQVTELSPFLALADQVQGGWGRGRCKGWRQSGIIVVVGASAGGLGPLRALLRGLPADLPAAVLVVLHIPSTGGRALPRILDRSGPLPAAAAAGGERIEHGHVYVAPPDRHLLVVKDEVRLSRGLRQNGFRPAADLLLRSAALHAGTRVTAVVLKRVAGRRGPRQRRRGAARGPRRGAGPAGHRLRQYAAGAISVTGRPVIVPAKALAEQVTRLAAGQGEMEVAGISEPGGELAAEISGPLSGSIGTGIRTRSCSGLTCPECGGLLHTGHSGRAEAYDCLVGHRWCRRAWPKSTAPPSSGRCGPPSGPWRNEAGSLPSWPAGPVSAVTRYRPASSTRPPPAAGGPLTSSGPPRPG